MKNATFSGEGGELYARILALSVAVTAFQHKAMAVEDLTVAVDKSVTLSAAAQYGTINIEGALSVEGGKTISVKTINMTGGSVSVSDQDTMLGSGNSGNAYPTQWNLYPDENGRYGKIKVSGVRAVDKGAGAVKFYLNSENDAARKGSGYIDFLELDKGSFNMRQAYNQSSLTGRITVASGGGTLYRRGKASTSSSERRMFDTGAWQVLLKDNAPFALNFAGQNGYLNKTDVYVEICGEGNVSINGSNGADYPATLNSGAIINNTGTLTFVRYETDRVCAYNINGSNIIGPNVSALVLTDNANIHDALVKIGTSYTVTLCGNVQITGKHAYLTGGKIKIDATAAPRSFKCNIKSGDSLVVEKVGANEMVVSATTNISNLVVSEGAVRFEGTNCEVSNLKMAAGTVLIADGCVVMIGSEFVGASLQTKNGGKFLKVGDSRTVIYNPVSMSGIVHVANGEMVFSKYGYDQKWWRWTFFSTKGGNYALRLRGIYLFGNDGTWQNSGLSYKDVATEQTDTVLAEKGCRFVINSATNIAVTISGSGTEDRNKISTLERWFTLKDGWGGNHYPMLSSPVINPEDPTSWVGVEMHIDSDSKPITGYNMRVATWLKNYADGWKVEASNDGKAWQVVDVRSGQISNASENYYSYDNTKWSATNFNLKELFHFTGYRNGGLAVMDPLSVQVDEGASLDLLAFDEGQPIEAITIDLTSGAGTVKGGRIVANGTLSLTGVEEAGFNLDDVLPIVLEDVKDTDNFASWTVFVDGRKIRRKVKYSEGRISVPPVGLVMMVK